ncbi:hypothetical protein ACP6EK_03215 [Candidatus Caldatribacterium sp. SIUC1]|uniref:hypothetical protein n=1 Tax=Candidatus Caldatribacterium sp. SIUC1 TaxID=3418365 RepID=UPI003F693640
MRRTLPLILALLVVFALVATGCGGTGGTQPPGPPQPALCTLRVQSTSPYVWGYVWVNGMNTGVYLDPMGVATVGQYPCGQQVSVQIVDQYGQFSHIEVVTMVSPVTTLNFSWW